jgi:hypothetical protein
MLELFDTILISLYRLTGNPLWDYFIGTFLLALLSVLVGQATAFMVLSANRNHLENLDGRFATLNRLTASAMEMGDKQSYKSLNKEANDAYGQVFFNRFGLSAASLWPVFFALAWMQEHFAQILIPIPFHNFNANYFVIFLGSYIMARIFFSRARRHFLDPHGQPAEPSTLLNAR